MSGQDRTVVVVGATGAQGGPVARALLRSGWAVRAATRNADGPAARALAALGAVPVRVDLRDPDTVVTAADGAGRAFLHLPMTLGGPGGGDVERAAANALRKAGVDHIVLNTGMALPQEPVGDPMLDAPIALATELADDGATVLVPTGYMENFSAGWSAPHVLAGELRYPLPADAVNAWVTNDDVGACVVAAFDRADAACARWFRVSGPEALTLPDVAVRLGRALGRPVRFRRISGAAYGEMMAPYLGEPLAAAVGAGYDRMPTGHNPLLAPDTTPTREALGVTFTSVEDWARRLDWRRAARAVTPR